MGLYNICSEKWRYTCSISRRFLSRFTVHRFDRWATGLISILSVDAIESFLTDISEMSCQETIDHDDPNSTPHHICPGVSGYELAMRHVGSGRQSIDVITPTI